MTDMRKITHIAFFFFGASMASHVMADRPENLHEMFKKAKTIQRIHGGELPCICPNPYEKSGNTYSVPQKKKIIMWRKKRDTSKKDNGVPKNWSMMAARAREISKRNRTGRPLLIASNPMASRG